MAPGAGDYCRDGDRSRLWLQAFGTGADGFWTSSKKYRTFKAAYDSKSSPDSPETGKSNPEAEGLFPLGVAANFLLTAGSLGLGGYSAVGNSTLAAQSSEPYNYNDYPANYGYIDPDAPNLPSEVRGWTTPAMTFFTAEPGMTP